MHSHNTKKNYSDIENLLLSVKKCENSSNLILHLTANENISSRLSRSYYASNLSYRYHLENTFLDKNFNNVTIINDFMLRKISGVIELENVARQKACEMFSSEWVDFRPVSGMNAMISVIMTATNPSDNIYLIPNVSGGHSLTAIAIQQLGRKIKFLPWIEKKNNIDLEKFQEITTSENPKIILFNHSDPLFPLPINKIRKISGPETLLIYDSSHTLGLIAGKQFQSPLEEGCDISHGSTHKSFPGPQKGMIYFKSKTTGHIISDKIGKGVISSQHTHHSIALYIATLEMSAFGNAYAKQIIYNARLLAQTLANHGFELFHDNGKYTDSHILLLAFNSKEICHKACIKLHECNISTNTRKIFNKYYIRIGVQEITRLGMREKEIELISILIKKAILDNEPADKIKREVIHLKKQFNNIHFSFDDIINFEELT
jgi:glycine hydroxymethyltransferase